MMKYGTISVVEMAELLAIHPESVRRLIRGGTLKAVRIGRSLRIDEVYAREFANMYDPRPGKSGGDAADIVVSEQTVIVPKRAVRTELPPRETKPKKRKQKAKKEIPNVDILTTADVAKLIRVTTVTVVNMAKRGDLKHFRAGSRYRFRVEDVLEYMGCVDLRDGERAVIEGLTTSPFMAKHGDDKYIPVYIDGLGYIAQIDNNPPDMLR